MKKLSHSCIHVAREYRTLDMKVGKCLYDFCRPFCTDCGDCCKPDICVEAVESAWLGMVWNQAGNRISQFSRSTGWLSLTGCKLKAGRPPLCYEFYCDRVSDYFRQENLLDSIRAISKLPSEVGRNALGKRHLVTLEEDEILNKLDFKKLSKKIVLAEKDLQHHLRILVPGR